MTVSVETLMAFVDGELAPDEARRVADELAKDPKLNSYVEQQKKLSARLKAAFAPVVEDVVPASIEKAVWDTPVPSGSLLDVPLIARLKRFWEKQTAHAGQSWIPAGAMAAGIALGLLLAGSFGAGSEMLARGGALIAQGALGRTLTVELASEQGEMARGTARIGVSFWSRNGSFCRSFTTENATRGALAGIACRDGTSWRIVALSDVEPSDQGEYSKAGASMPAMIRNTMSSLILGDPLDAEQERAARNQGWAPQ